MINDLFDINFDEDPMAIPKAFFNSLYDIDFLWRMKRVASQKHVADEFHGCSFPDDIDWDEEPFQGVKFRFRDEEIIIDLEQFKELALQALDAFLKFHPEKIVEVNMIRKMLDF